MTTAQLYSLSTAQFSGLTTDQIVALTTQQVSGLSSADLGALSSDQLAALTTDDIVALRTSQLAAVDTMSAFGTALRSVPSKIVTLVASSATTSPVTVRPSAVSILVDRYLASTSAFGSMTLSTNLTRVFDRSITLSRFGP